MPARSPTIIGLANGADDPARETAAFHAAIEALRRGERVVMVLTEDGARLAVPGYADGVGSFSGPPVAALQQQFIALGGRFQVCRECLRARKVPEKHLVPGATLTSEAALREQGRHGAFAARS
jgi:predicted peroxiredoxin